MYRTDFDLCLLNNDKTGARRRQDGCWKDPGPNPIAGQALPESQQKIAMFPTNTVVWNFYQPVLVSCVHRGCEYKAIPISASSHRDYAANCARFLAPERQMGRIATGGIARSISLRQLIPRT